MPVLDRGDDGAEQPQLSVGSAGGRAAIAWMTGGLVSLPIPSKLVLDLVPSRFIVTAPMMSGPAPAEGAVPCPNG